jgi:hypothetical protein
MPSEIHIVGLGVNNEEYLVKVKFYYVQIQGMIFVTGVDFAREQLPIFLQDEDSRNI